jgi:hypothetical protein
MATNKKKKVNLSTLKGIKLYNFLVKELGEANDKLPNQQKIGATKRRQLVSTIIYPKFKAKDKLSIREIRTDIRRVVKTLPPKEICNPLYLSEAYLAFVEYYEIDNHIRTVLPDCLDVRVNAGSLGKTKVFNTRNYSYYGDGVRKITENIREDLAQNQSGMAYFSGVVKLKHNKKNDGNPDNYFVEYILYINDVPEVNDESVNFDLPAKEQKKVDQINDYLAGKFKELQKEKRKRKRIAKKTAPKKPAEEKKELNAAVRNAIKSLQELVKKKVITKAQFEKQKKSILAFKNKK